jgi:probable rRNA maturation factor
VHGILHLLGYDHAEPDEHAAMFGLQDQLLTAWQATKQETERDTKRAAKGQEGPG